MKRFVVGLLLGLLLGSVVTVTASHLSQGYLIGWDVVRVSRGGQTLGIICSDPYVAPSVREIECE